LIQDILERVSSNTLAETADTSSNHTLCSADVAAGHAAEVSLEVRWMASGNAACTLQVSESMSVSDVKAQVQEQVKIPAVEQRLFCHGEEINYEESLQLEDPAASELMLVRSFSDPRATDLAYFHPTTQFESLESANFTRVRMLSRGINGDIYQYRWRGNQHHQDVAVKKLRNRTLEKEANAEIDERCIHTKPQHGFASNEDAMTEIGILMYLSKQQDASPYLLKMHGVFAESQHTWLVTEFADGGELFNVAAAGPIAEKTVQQYMWQLLQAVGYLHQHQIGHRDISLENVLLKGGVVRLMDYGMAVRSHSSSGVPLRYYREVGKAFYRSPECYVPTRDEVLIAAPASAQPGDVVFTRVPPSFLCEVRLPQDVTPGASCKAETWGYAVVPADVWAVGICMFILAFQCPAWEHAKLSNRFFAQAYNSGEGVASLLKIWGKEHILSAQAMDMLSSMLQAEPTQRPSPADCLNHPWLAEEAAKHVEERIAEP
jgi:serine/threonine protein kinase